MKYDDESITYMVNESLKVSCFALILLYLYFLDNHIRPTFDYYGTWTRKTPLHPGDQGISFNQLPFDMKIKVIKCLSDNDLRRFSYTSKDN